MHRFILTTRSLIMGSGCFEELSLGSLNKFFSVCTRVCSTTTTTYLVPEGDAVFVIIIIIILIVVTGVVVVTIALVVFMNDRANLEEDWSAPALWIAR